MKRRSSVEHSEATSGHEMDLGVYNLEYLGTVPVDSALGQEMCTKAIDRLTIMKIGNRPIFILVTSKRIILTDKKSGDVLKSVPISAITFVCNTASSRFLSIVESGSQAVNSCHGFKVANKSDGHSIANAIKLIVRLQQGKIHIEPLQKIMNDKKTKISKRLIQKIDEAWQARSENVTRGERLATYRCHYYGTALVSSEDEEVTDQEANKLFERGFSTATQMIIYEKFMEIIGASGRITFQFYHMGDIVFAKMMDVGVSLVVRETVGQKVYHSVSVFEMAWGDARNATLLKAVDAARLGDSFNPNLNRNARRGSVESFGGFGDEDNDDDGDADINEDDSAIYLAPVPVDRQEMIYNDAKQTAGLAKTALGSPKDDFVSSTNARAMFYLMPSVIGGGPSFALIEMYESGSVRGTDSGKLTCQYAGSVQVFPPFAPPPISENDVGKHVIVEGYDCRATLQFFGKHHVKGNMKAGVVLSKAIGKNNGTIKGHKYFMCKSKHGVLVDPAKVKIETSLHSSWTATVQSAVNSLVKSKTTSIKACVVVNKKTIEIRSGDGRESWYMCKANEIAYFAKFGENKALVFVALNPVDGHLYCRILMGSIKQIPQIFDQIAAARNKSKKDNDFFPNFRAIHNDASDGVVYDYLASHEGQCNYYGDTEGISAKSKRAKLFASSADKESDDDNENNAVGIFEGQYLGSETFTSSGQVGKNRAEKNQATEKAVKKILSRSSKELVFIMVGIEGIKVRAALTEESVSAFVIEDIRFTTVIPKWSKNGDIFAVLQKDKNLGVVNCHAYLCAPDRAKSIADAISAAFMHFQVKRSADPFAASGKRLAAPAALFKRQVHRADLKADEAIGAGQFGQVYAATQTVDSGEKQRAVKMLRGAASEADRQDFTREAEIMLELDHANLVEMIGVCVQQAPWLIVLEFLEYGDLRTVLKACVTKRIKLALFEQLKWMGDISAGMSFLEEHEIIHMDLAARNCLLGEDNMLKVADFGLAVKLTGSDDYHTVSIDSRIPIKWCAPEALTNRQFSVKSDVWAAGVTFWEIFAYGTMPYAEVPISQMARKLQEGTRLILPRTVPQNIVSLVQSCWSMGKIDRPSFQHLKAELQIYFRDAASTAVPRDIGATLHKSTSDFQKDSVTDLGGGDDNNDLDTGYEYGGTESQQEGDSKEDFGYEYGGAQEVGKSPYRALKVHNAKDVTGDFEQVYMEYQTPDGDIVSFMSETHDMSKPRKSTFGVLSDMTVLEEEL